MEAPTAASCKDLQWVASSLKLTCSVHGPKPVPRAASFSPNLQLTSHVKFAPFATRQRRAYIRDTIERDLGVHLETALRGVIIPDRWPKSAVDVVVTVLEGEEDSPWGYGDNEKRRVDGAGTMNILAGCITVASAALADAGIDCLDLLAGGVAGVVPLSNQKSITILDPSPTEHEELSSVCVVGYLPARDEITELWIRGDLSGAGNDSAPGFEGLVDSAVNAARGARVVLQEAVKESAERRIQLLKAGELTKSTTMNDVNDVEMKT